MVKAYFFDWIGTLGDVGERNCIREFVTTEQHASLLTKPFKDADILEEYRQEIYDRLINEDHFLYPETGRVISDLKPNYKLGIISNMYEIAAQRIRKLFPEFLSHFDIITFSSEVGMKKPNEKIFLYTLNRLNERSISKIISSEVMMIGDKQAKDEKPAIKLGMQARLINREIQDLEDVIFYKLK